MKKTSTKKAIICLGVLFFLLWSFIVSAITIDPWRFVATMRIQQVNLYYRITSTNSEYEVDDIVKAWLTNYWWVNKWVLYIRPVDSTGNLVDETNNVVTNPDYASIIWWQMNTNNGDETTIILWWSKNTAGGHWVVLMWWDANVATVDNSVILWSANSTVWSTNWVIMASYGWSVYWNNSTIFWWGWQISTWADNSFAIGWGVTINHQWVFSYGWSTSIKPNIAQFNSWKWVIVWWTKPNGNSHIKLSVNWALAVWRGECSNGMLWSIYYKAGTVETQPGVLSPLYCLCACVASGSVSREIALSNQPYCDGICGGGGSPRIDCWTRWSEWTPMAYANWENWWRVASKFCLDNRPPIAYQVYVGSNPVEWKWKTCEHSSADCNPPFPEPGETVKWTCHWLWYNDFKDCYAYRDLEAPELANCGRNSKRYGYYDTGWLWTNESDFCMHLNLGAGSSDRAHNWELTAYRVLTGGDVETELKSGGLVKPYITWDRMQIRSKLISDEDVFPPYGWRTYWKCVTSNTWNEVRGREITNEKICYADRMPCNTCAKDWFPYCFSIDFNGDCDWTGDIPCLPGWRKKIHVSWNITQVTDSLRVDENEIAKVVKEGGNFEVNLHGKEVTYSFKEGTNGKNETDKQKEFKATFKTITGSYYCDWTTTIYQCQKWYTWDDAQQDCVKDKCYGDLAPWAVLPSENEEELETSLEIFLTWGENANYKAKCASRCARVGDTYKDRNGEEHEADMDLTFLKNPITGKPFCAKCEEWTAIPEAWYCQFKDKADCMEPYVWFDIDKWLCALPWSCQGIDFDRMVQDMEEIIPVANTWGTPIDWSCVQDDLLDEDGKLPKDLRHKCIITCQKQYICSQGRCKEPECDMTSKNNSWQWLIDNINKGELYRKAWWNNEFENRDSVLYDNKDYINYFVPRTDSHVVEWNNKFRFLNSELQRNVSNASFYYDVWTSSTVKLENPTLVWDPWIFVEARDKKEFDEKTDWLKWCFYMCTWDNFRMEVKKNWSVSYYCSVKPNPCDLDPASCEINTNPWNPSPGGGNNYVRPVKRLCSGSINIKWKYKYSAEYWYEDEERYQNWTTRAWHYVDTPTGDPCEYWCDTAAWYVLKKFEDGDVCWKKCDPDKNEYVVDNVCYTCPSGKYPTTWDVDSDGRAKGCYSKCTASQYISSNGYCYSCGAGKKWNPNKKDIYWNSKDCVNICADWRTFWTNRKDKTDCGVKNGQAVPNCCLATYAGANYDKCNKLISEHKDCEIVGANCVCHDDMTWV